MLLVMVKFYHLKDCGNGDDVDSVDDGDGDGDVDDGENEIHIGENAALDNYIDRVKSIPATVVLQKSSVRYRFDHANPKFKILP